MEKKMKTRKGKDGFDYPYTSPDIVIDENRKSVTKKFEEINLQYKAVNNKVDKSQLSFNSNGELVVTINGVSKTFVPKA